MKIDVAEVRHVAQLAELAVAEAELEALARQLEGIVAFVAQLGEVDLPPVEPGSPVGPAAVTLRDDAVHPIPMSRAPVDFAPEFEQGFFVVPRLGGLADE
jgi:aspartyl-tRNA(Asn)/glutamyl-tRNA(Gln) amidotransferase subunit C